MKTIIDIIYAALVGIAVFLIGWAFGPGHTNLDTIKMLDQARSGVFNDWHSPLVSGVWYLIGGPPWAMPITLYVNLVAFAGLTYQIFKQASFSHRVACLLTILVCYIPPVLSGLGMVGKDTWVATLFLGVLVLSILYHSQSRIYLLALRNVCFVLASLIRPEFIIIAGLFLFMEAVFITQLWRVVTNGFAVLALLFTTSFGVTSLEHTARYHPEQQLFLNDLASLSLAENKLLIPEPFSGAVDLAILRKHYQNPTLDNNLFGQPENEMLKYSSDPEAVKDLKARWINAVIHDPVACLEHRFKLLESYFWVGSYFATDVDVNDYGLHIYHTGANDFGVAYMGAFNRSPIQRHFLSFYGSLALLFMLYRQAARTLFDKYLMIALVCDCFYQLLVGIIGMNPAWRYGFAAEVIFWIALAVVAVRVIGNFIKPLFVETPQ